MKRHQRDPDPTAASTAGTDVCPCGTGLPYNGCCGRFIDGRGVPETATELMRSRYTAFVRGDETYLRKTWCLRTRPEGALFALPLPQWLGLKIVNATQDGDAATVEFVARYKTNGRAHKLHETSRFLREHNDDGDLAWCYVDGQFR